VLTGTRLHAAAGDSEQISVDVDVDADHVIDPVRQRLDHEPGARADVEQAAGPAIRRSLEEDGGHVSWHSGPKLPVELCRSLEQTH